jgi:drug/metabolite transporter (DMT)-like permease
MKDFILFTLIVVAGTGGELCVSRAMKSVGEAKGFHPVELARLILRALREPWMWLGVAMMASGFFALLGALAALPVSFVVPMTALSYVVGVFGGVTFLKEKVTRQRWIGVALVALGVSLVLLGKR